MTTFQPGRLAGQLAATALLAATCSAFAADAPTTVPSSLGAIGTTPTLDNITMEPGLPSDAKRVYVLDPGHFHVTTTVYTIDGNKNNLLGMTDTGKLANVMLSSDGKFFVTSNTTYSRIARGKRDDYVEVIDAQSHKVLADIDIPEGRFLTGVMNRMASLSTDNKYMLFQQFAPSPAVGLVDLEKKSFVKMMDIPDCYQIFPVPNQSFYMHCRDGSLQQFGYDDKGNLKPMKPTKVFHGEDDYLFVNPYYSNGSGRLVWPTYEGRIFQAKLTDKKVDFMKPFELFTEAEKKANWRPGGWQVVAYHKARNEIYVLADQRAKWTHVTASRYVFVVDGTTGKRLRRIDLGHEIDGISVTQDANPNLYAVSAEAKTLFTFNAVTGKETGKVDELGRAPTISLTMD
ncbi:methylamine dehydrogenase (amicyanin) large subunit [Methylobacillus flagellatus]|uniref:Methylamine dehydrogenase heavy chain n=1 Tax=Methylobacillus flagellatus (strain ATCC 51484 / DSM 6875 / VKM B-1610 / KT) TaxID=265072 RepID=DHMH_METFK|nr:methylamine dehydrogenase (amicyanin) large subunit [Methylobacillus flagellatus]Q50420.3 RecName: Full=Methylamine dehydrogenase heavy chain; Short=MADH; AltName: Full=Methylamine dehydrogenase (amicyanin); Flags: Precursor [Methylobacillus flagellatus KT]AAC41469.2 methylamine dehydrogenase, large subunit [Methylobacillus flagellatus]ABE48818.1 Amine dehydrogenase [Methylobacillus flagellatus KT]